MKTILYQNCQIFIGRNKAENDKLLKDSDKQDHFFHLTTFPSCFIILKSSPYVTPQVLQYCADLCLQHTKYRHLNNVKVDHCRCKNVKSTSVPGEIEYRSYRQVDILRAHK